MSAFDGAKIGISLNKQHFLEKTSPLILQNSQYRTRINRFNPIGPLHFPS